MSGWFRSITVLLGMGALIQAGAGELIIEQGSLLAPAPTPVVVPIPMTGGVAALSQPAAALPVAPDPSVPVSSQLTLSQVLSSAGTPPLVQGANPIPAAVGAVGAVGAVQGQGQAPSAPMADVQRGAWALQPNSLYGAVSQIAERHGYSVSGSNASNSLGMRMYFKEQLPLSGSNLESDLNAFLDAVNQDRVNVELHMYPGNSRVVAKFFEVSK